MKQEQLAVAQELIGQPACCFQHLDDPLDEGTVGHPLCGLPSNEEVVLYRAGLIVPALDGQEGMGWRWERTAALTALAEMQKIAADATSDEIDIETDRLERWTRAILAVL